MQGGAARACSGRCGPVIFRPSSRACDRPLRPRHPLKVGPRATRDRSASTAGITRVGDLPPASPPPVSILGIETAGAKRAYVHWVSNVVPHPGRDTTSPSERTSVAERDTASLPKENAPHGGGGRGSGKVHGGDNSLQYDSTTQRKETRRWRSWNEDLELRFPEIKDLALARYQVPVFRFTRVALERRLARPEVLYERAGGLPVSGEVRRIVLDRVRGASEASRPTGSRG